MSLSGMSTQGKVATGLLTLFFIALTPPGVLLANSDTLLAGQPPLYLWAAGWGVFGIIAFLWAAKADAFAITEDQVPPELRQQDTVVTTEQDADSRAGGDN